MRFQPRFLPHPHSLRGFTLIELLVVIAIIGVLSAVVLAAIDGTPVSASDASIKSQLQQVSSQMELDYAGGSGYGQTFISGPCPTTSNPPNPIFYTDTHLQSLLSSIESASGFSYITCATGGSVSSAATSWAVASPLKSLGVNGLWWCVDSKGDEKLNYLGSGSFFALFEQFFGDKAYAAVGGTGPNLGGGSNPAVCP